MTTKTTTSSAFLAELVDRARNDPRRVLLVDGADPVAVTAARRVADLGAARPALLGDAADVRTRAAALGVDLSGIDLVEADDVVVDDVVHRHVQHGSSLKPDTARQLFAVPLFLAMGLLSTGRVDAVVAGLRNATAEVVTAAQLVLGPGDDAFTPSSLFVMDIPGYRGPQGGLLAFADCAVVVAPDAHRLADIALASAHTVERLLGWTPRVALLSFSTKGSGADLSVERVRHALRIVRDRRPDLAVDGELQADAALDPRVAARKIGEPGPVAGRANVLVFPDLAAANIAYKLVQRLAGAGAYGPLLQGLSGTVSDLSRGATVDDVVTTTVMAALRSRS